MEPISNNQLLDPRLLLVNELERRCRENPRYSLRAFAKALEISPSALSMILSGRRGLSKRLAAAVGKKLGLDPLAAESFVKGASRRGRLTTPESQNFSQISLDKFATIAEWHHFAILSLIETVDFVPKIPWIASRLDISVNAAKAAVERLVRLEILDISKNHWRQVGAPIFLDNNESTAATRRHQQQVLEKAVFSLENDAMELREMNSVTIALDPQKVGFARTEIRKFLMELMQKLESKGRRTEVYHLSAQLYPVSKNRGN